MHPIKAAVPLLYVFLFVSLVSGLPQQPTVTFKDGLPLDRLPGAGILKRLSPLSDAFLTLTPARITGPEGAAVPLVDYVAPVYRDDGAGEHNVFGPTLRLKGGDTIRITVANNLTQYERGGEIVEPNGYFHAGRHNLHAHGVHAWPGVEEQTLEAMTNYHGGDNIFPTYEPKASPEAEPAVQNYTLRIGRDHMPGLFWYHPHHHGSTVAQVPTANGLIVVEENEDWLPEEAGCGEVYSLLQEAEERFLHLSLFIFHQPTHTTRTAAGSKYQNQQWAIDRDDSSLQVFNALVEPKNPTAAYGISGAFNNTDFLLVNGAWQPVIEMKSGEFQRWRLADATIKRFQVLQIIDPETEKPAPQCELLLLAKDGHYLLQIPRKVDHIFLVTGNRAELLVKCSGAVGKEYILRSGDAANNPYGGAACSFNTSNNLVQETVARIRIVEIGVDQPPPKLEDCTPRRAGYAQDLQDASLEAHGATDKLLPQEVTFTINGAFGCQVNGKNFTLPDDDPIVLPLGTVVEWAVNAVPIHPLHTHINPFQLIGLPPEEELRPGCTVNPWFQLGDFQDTLMLPQYLQDSSPVRVRIQPGEHSGVTVMHCHALQHEDMGCMKVVVFTCPGMNTSQAQPNPCPGFKFPVPGTYPVTDY